MTEIYHNPIVTGESNAPATLNSRFATLDAGINTVNTVLGDRIDDLIIDAGTSDAETIAARTAINYGTAPATLGAALELVAGNVYNVMAYGAVGNGSTDDYAAIVATLTAAGSDSVVVFPAGYTFKTETEIGVASNHVIILGYGATLDSSTLDDFAISITGEYVTIEGLRFVGPPMSTATLPTAFLGSRGIDVQAKQAMIRNCRMEGFSGGGIRLAGHNCSVIGCHFYGVRHVTGADWLGVIYTIRNHGTITGNVIEECWDTGIHIRGGNHNTVSGNTIEFSTHVNQTKGMGIRMNVGSNYNTISGNTVRYAPFESILVVAASGQVSNGNVIVGNTVADGGLIGISVASDSGTCNYNVIVGNYIHAEYAELNQGIYLNSSGTSPQVYHTLVSGNSLVGVNSGGTSQLSAGIRTNGGGTKFSQITGNHVVNVNGTGITCVGEAMQVSNNYIMTTTTGISASFCIDSLITDNMIRASSTSAITLGSTVGGLVVSNNTIDKVITLSSPSGTYLAERNNIVGVPPTGQVGLSSGSATVTNDAFLAANYGMATVELHNISPGGTPGALYVHSINTGTGQAVFKSTSSTDTSSIRWRCVR